MKVYLNHLDPKRFHSAYQELLKNHYVEYIYKKKLSNTASDKKSLVFDIGKLFFNFLKLPTANFISRTDFDIIHSCQSFPISKKPYVVDFEHVSAFGGWNHKRVNSPFFKFFLKSFLESDRCKKILPWTNSAALSLKNLSPSKKIEDKIEVVYPTMSMPKIKSKKNKKEFVFIFVAFNFYRKGGEEAVKAFVKLSKKVKNTKLIVISSIEKTFENYKNEKISFLGLKPKQEILEKYYPNADVFLYPTYNDSYGMVFLEAMSFGLPIITIEDFASKELIVNEKNGFVIKGYKKKWYDDKYLTREGSNNIATISSWRGEEEKERIIDDLYQKMLIVCKDERLREKISQNNLLEIKEGRFSIEKRNKQLKRIYEEAIR